MNYSLFNFLLYLPLLFLQLPQFSIFKDFSLIYNAPIISILKDREWKHLSKNISIMPIVTNTQDSILLLRCNNDIFINLNDAGLYSSKFIKKTISKFRRKFLMSISSFEADMINFFDENNNFIKPAIANKFSAGDYLSMLANVLGAK